MSEIPEEPDNTTSGPTMEVLEKKFVNKEVWALMKESVDQATINIGEMKEAMASMAKWMELHHETHAGGWKKAHTVAVVAASVIAGVSLICTVIIGVVSVLKWKI